MSLSGDSSSHSNCHSDAPYYHEPRVNPFGRTPTTRACSSINLKSEEHIEQSLIVSVGSYVLEVQRLKGETTALEDLMDNRKKLAEQLSYSQQEKMELRREIQSLMGRLQEKDNVIIRLGRQLRNQKSADSAEHNSLKARCKRLQAQNEELSRRLIQRELETQAKEVNALEIESAIRFRQTHPQRSEILCRMKKARQSTEELRRSFVCFAQETQQQIRHLKQYCVRQVSEAIAQVRLVASSKETTVLSPAPLSTLQAENDELKLRNFELSAKLTQLARQMSFICRLQQLYKQTSLPPQQNPQSVDLM